jgi:hypothetical protein
MIADGFPTVFIISELLLRLRIKLYHGSNEMTASCTRNRLRTQPTHYHEPHVI